MRLKVTNKTWHLNTVCSLHLISQHFFYIIVKTVVLFLVFMFNHTWLRSAGHPTEMNEVKILLLLPRFSVYELTKSQPGLNIHKSANNLCGKTQISCFYSITGGLLTLAEVLLFLFSIQSMQPYVSFLSPTCPLSHSYFQTFLSWCQISAATSFHPWRLTLTFLC